MVKNFLSQLLSIKEEEFVLTRLKQYLLEQKKLNLVVEEIKKPELREYHTPKSLMFFCIVAVLASPFYGFIFLKKLDDPSISLLIISLTLICILALVFIPKVLIEDKLKEEFNAKMSEYNSKVQEQKFNQKIMNQKIGINISMIDSEIKSLRHIEGEICRNDFTALKNRTYPSVAIGMDLIDDKETSFLCLRKRLRTLRHRNEELFKIDKVYENLELVDVELYPTFYQSVIKTMEEFEYLKTDLEKLLSLDPNSKVESALFKMYLKLHKEKNNRIAKEFAIVKHD